MAAETKISFSKSNEFLQAQVAKQDVTFFGDTNHDKLAIRTFMNQNFAAMVEGGVTDLVLEVPATEELQTLVNRFMAIKPENDSPEAILAAKKKEDAIIAAHWGKPKDEGERVFIVEHKAMLIAAKKAGIQHIHYMDVVDDRNAFNTVYTYEHDPRYQKVRPVDLTKLTAEQKKEYEDARAIVLARLTDAEKKAYETVRDFEYDPRYQGADKKLDSKKLNKEQQKAYDDARGVLSSKLTTEEQKAYEIVKKFEYNPEYQKGTVAFDIERLTPEQKTEFNDAYKIFEKQRNGVNPAWADFVADVKKTAKGKIAVFAGDAHAKEFRKFLGERGIKSSYVRLEETKGKHLHLVTKGATEDKEVPDAVFRMPERAALLKLVDKAAYEVYAQDIGKASGIAGQFGPDVVTVDKDGITLTLSPEVLKKLPADAQEGAIDSLASALYDRLNKAAPGTLGGVIRWGSDGKIQIPFKAGLKEDQIADAVKKFREKPEVERDVIKEVLAKGKDNSDSKYTGLIRKALGADGYSLSITQSPTDRQSSASLYLKGGQDPDKMLEKLKPIFEAKFGKDNQFLKVVNTDTTPSTRTIGFDLKTIAKYDTDNGAGAFEKALQDIQPKINEALGINKPEPVPDTTPPKPKGFMDYLSDNKGLGIGGIIGAILGWLFFGLPGLAIGTLLLGGVGAAMDGKEGVLGIGGDSTPPMSPRLKTAVTEYAKLRFTNLETGAVDQVNVDKFVARYESMVAKNMTPEQQEKRAGEITAETAKIKGQIRDAVTAPDMGKAVETARQTMTTADRELITMTDPGAGPPLGTKFTPAIVEKVAENRR